MKSTQLFQVLIPCLIAGSVLSPMALAARCPGKVDPKKVILFLDMNGSEEEIASAEKAACARGEVLKVIPEEWRERAALRKENYGLAKKIKKLKCSSLEREECMELIVSQRKTKMKANALPAISSEMVNSVLGDLSNKGAVVSSFIVSGHDGGGAFSGEMRGDEIIFKENLVSAFDAYPELQKSVQSLLLLGCYSVVPSEILDWKAGFPEVKVLAGYEGSAPKSDKIAGHTYIEDILMKELKITQAANEKKLEQLLSRGIRNIQNINASVYVNLDKCQSPNVSDKEFLYRPLLEDGERFSTFGTKGCPRAIARYRKEIQQRLYAYQSGQMEVPEDTQNGEMRSLYDFVRQNQHCFDYGEIMDGDRAMMLLFFRNVKLNWANANRRAVEEAEKAISEIDEQKLSARIEEQLQKLKKEMLDFEADRRAFEEHPVEYLEALKKELAAAEEKCRNLEEQGDASKKALEARVEVLDLTSKMRSLSIADPEKKARYWDRAAERLRKSIEWKEFKWAAAIPALNDLKSHWWSPNVENMQKKSRKEILELAHLLGGAHSYMPLASEQSGSAFQMMAASLEWQLVELVDIPFAWHERPEGL